MSRATVHAEPKTLPTPKAVRSRRVKGVRVTVAEARKRFTELLGQVATGRVRVVLERDGKIVGFLGTPKDLALVVEDEEDREDIAAAQEALAEMERTGEKAIPLEEVCRELGLD